MNWVKTQDVKLLPSERKLWFKVESVKGAKRIAKSTTAVKTKVYSLGCRLVPRLNSALSDQAEVGSAVTLRPNVEPKRVFQGVTPGHDGFVLTPSEMLDVVHDGRSRHVVHPYLTGSEILTGDGTPERFIIGFGRRDILDSQRFTRAFEHIRETVLPDLQMKATNEHESETARKLHMDRWWMLWRDRLEMFEGFRQLSGRFVACSRVTKRPIFVFFTTSVWPSDKVQAFLFDDDYSFGVLQSAAHWHWFVAKSSKLTERLSYSIESVFETFPWPQSPTAKQVEAVAKAGREVRRVRDENLPKIKGGLRALYRTLELPGANPLKEAQTELDAAVLAAYGFSLKKDLLAQLLALNLEVAQRIDAGKSVVAPGIPPDYSHPKKLVTDDCIQPRAPSLT